MALEARAVSRTSPIVVKRRWAYDAVPLTFDIDGLKCGKNISTTIKRIYKESAKLTHCYDLTFGTNDWWNLSQTVPVIGMDSMTRTRIHYTWYNLMLSN